MGVYRSPFRAYIMSGIPGSGKSTYCRDVIQVSPENYCSADEFHMEAGVYNWRPERVRSAHHWCLRKFTKCCEDGQTPVVCDNTNVTMREVAPYVAIAQAHGYETEVIVMHADVADAVRRNVHGVPEDVIRRMHREHELLWYGDPGAGIASPVPSWWMVTRMRGRR